jgi:hypothetical protein
VACPLAASISATSEASSRLPSGGHYDPSALRRNGMGGSPPDPTARAGDQGNVIMHV